MTVVHFDPYRDDDYYDGPAPCGTIVGENYNSNSLWVNVTCKRCIKKRDALDKSFKDTEKVIIDQMGDMADFFEKCSECKEDNCDNCPQLEEDK